MDYSNETYVRIYVRDTITWKRLGWEGATVFMWVTRKLTRAGKLELSGESPADAIELITSLPREVVEAGLARCIEQGTLEVVDDCLVDPEYIAAQESTYSKAQRSRLYRARKAASRERNEALRERDEASRQPDDADDNAEPHEVSRERDEASRERDETERGRGTLLHSTTQHINNAATAGVNAERVKEKKKQSKGRKRNRNAGTPTPIDDSSLFAGTDVEQQRMLKLVTGNPRKEERKKEQARLLERLGNEVFRVYIEKRKKATGSDYIKDRAKVLRAARELGVACVGYGITPVQVIDYWCANDWTTAKFPTLHFIAGGPNVDRAACSLKPATGIKPKTKGPMEAVRGEDWEDFEDDYDQLVGKSGS